MVTSLYESKNSQVGWKTTNKQIDSILANILEKIYSSAKFNVLVKILKFICKDTGFFFADSYKFHFISRQTF